MVPGRHELHARHVSLIVTTRPGASVLLQRMHLPTHILSGWCAASVLRLSPRERLFCMVAATGADLDGVSFLFGQDAYWNWHHVLGHNIFFALAMAGVLAAFSQRKLASYLLYLALAHLHLVMDYYGSGEHWPLFYLWPASGAKFQNPGAWPFLSWQNLLALAALFGWTVAIAIRQRRTPFELIAPQVDQRILRWLGAAPSLHLPESQS